MGIEHPHRHTIAKQRKRDPSYPPERWIFRKKRPADMVNRHSKDGDHLDKIGIQIGFQLWFLHACNSPFDVFLSQFTQGDILPCGWVDRKGWIF
jgi:hypothetical protein